MTESLRKFVGFLPREGWVVGPVGYIRRAPDQSLEDLCPVCFLASSRNTEEEIYDNSDWDSAASDAGLSYEEASMVVAAADKDLEATEYDPELRKALLEWCGLKERVS